jgi:hypothetical protein
VAISCAAFLLGSVGQGFVLSGAFCSYFYCFTPSGEDVGSVPRKPNPDSLRFHIPASVSPHDNASPSLLRHEFVTGDSWSPALQAEHELAPVASDASAYGARGNEGLNPAVAGLMLGSSDGRVSCPRGRLQGRGWSQTRSAGQALVGRTETSPRASTEGEVHASRPVGRRSPAGRPEVEEPTQGFPATGPT